MIPAWLLGFIIVFCLVFTFTMIIGANLNSCGCFLEVHRCQKCNNYIGRKGDIVRAWVIDELWLFVSIISYVISSLEYIWSTIATSIYRIVSSRTHSYCKEQQWLLIIMLKMISFIPIIMWIWELATVHSLDDYDILYLKNLTAILISGM